MAFQFNFDIGDDDEHSSETAALSSITGENIPQTECNSTDTLKDAKEFYAPTNLSAYESCTVDVLNVGDLELCFLNPEDVESQLNIFLSEGVKSANQDDSDVSKAIESHSDLIPNVYEGGLKVWECSVDLVHYLQEADIPLKNNRVLELGCGAGLPGIYAVKKGAAAVHFQDYNEEVIEHMTIPSVMLNKMEDTSSNQDLRYFAGDWTLVEVKLASEDPSKKYDIILTSETIYSLESHDKLYKILRSLLSRNGVIYLAAKTHYFGVGGGTRAFEDMVRRGEFNIEVCKTFTEGVKREILKMVFLQTPKD